MRMRRSLSLFVLAGICSRAAFAASTLPAAGTAGAASQPYQKIAAHLESGGDLFVVANLQGVVKDVGTYIGTMVDAISTTAGAGTAAGQTNSPFVQRLSRFVALSGLEAVNGYGLSVVPRGDGLHSIKGFVGRDPDAANRTFWKAMVGGTPKRLKSLDYLPRDTVMARTSAGQPDAMWSLVRQGFETIGGAAGKKQLAQMEMMLTMVFGTNVEAIVQALEADSFFSVQLSSSDTFTIPLPGKTGAEAFTMPTPSLLLGIMTRGATPARAIEAALARGGMPLERRPYDGVTLVCARPPMPLPLPFTISIAEQEGMLLLGSTTNCVQDAIRASKAHNGLTADPEFRRATAGMPEANNGLDYVHPRFYATMRDVQTAIAKANGTEALARMQNMLMSPNEMTAGALVNGPDGVTMMGVSTCGTREMISRLTLVPFAMFGGIAVPSFVRARSQAQSNVCINNLRMIDGAKEQWAMENNKTDADTPTEEDLGKYLNGNILPRCPMGGSYTIGPVGERPKCTRPGHALSR
ncbi:MAG: hypothetical protein PHR35_01345 [Kiritimatiellae bacterium]|nr:hypothetical protein [Kiritimatiellia bacterium]